MITMQPIAHMRSAFPEKFGIPRQSGLVEGLPSTIVFEPEYRNPDALRGLEGFSHIWLIWGFSEISNATWSPTVRPPRLGGNARMGVFATRSPNRPNPLGLSSVKIDQLENHPTFGPVIHVLGGDLMDGTPIYDIKPYIPYTDSHPEASSGYANSPPEKRLQVVIPAEFHGFLSEKDGALLSDLLALDPRPSYQHDPDRIYGMRFRGYEIKFKVAEAMLSVISIIASGNE